MRAVTERDLRMPEFIDAKPEDLEFRDDGRLVRKDRWEAGIRNIASILGWTRKDFEVPDVVAEVLKLKERSPERTELLNLKMDLQRVIDDEPTLCNFEQVEALLARLDALSVLATTPKETPQ